MSDAEVTRIIHVHDRTWELEEGWTLTATLTDEGIVLDLRDENGHQQGTTYWFTTELEEKLLDDVEER